MIFIGIGVFILVEFIQKVGLRWQGVTGYIFALAIMGLGVVRIRAGWPRSRGRS